MAQSTARRKQSGPMSARQRRQDARDAAAKARRNQNMLVIGAGVALVAIVAFFIYLNVRSRAPMAGEEVFNSQGNSHIQYGSRSPIEYNSTPPSSGPHYDNLAAWNVYTEPIRYEQLNHNLEDGGVIIYYQCPDGCPELFDELKAMAEPYINAGRHVVMAPNDPAWSIDGSEPLHKDMGASIALVSWQHVLKLDEFDQGRIRAFIEKYEGIDHHVGATG